MEYFLMDHFTFIWLILHYFVHHLLALTMICVSRAAQLSVLSRHLLHISMTSYIPIAVVCVIMQCCVLIKNLYIIDVISLAVGLCTAVSIVLYITFINDGVHYAGPEKENSYFEYRYGWSAYVLTISYLSSQVAAVLCVTLFLQRYPNVNDLVRLIPGLDKKVPKPEDVDQGTLI